MNVKEVLLKKHSELFSKLLKKIMLEKVPNPVAKIFLDLTTEPLFSNEIKKVAVVERMISSISVVNGDIKTTPFFITISKKTIRKTGIPATEKGLRKLLETITTSSDGLIELSFDEETKNTIILKGCIHL